MKIQVNPHEIQRQVVLSFCLEATLPKTECTSRYRDIGPKQKFEDFLVSAINSGRYFYELAERINREQGQPRVFYDLAYNTLINSQKSRTGKIVNYGLLESMFPVVVTRCIKDGDGLDVLKAVPEVLKDTSKEDVKHVVEMRKAIYLRSDKRFKREFPFVEAGDNVFEHYEAHRDIAHEASRLFVEELISGLPLSKTIYQSLSESDKFLQDRLSRGFDEAKKTSNLPYGAVADFSALALFLHISDNPDFQLIN